MRRKGNWRAKTSKERVQACLKVARALETLELKTLKDFLIAFISTNKPPTRTGVSYSRLRSYQNPYTMRVGRQNSRNIPLRASLLSLRISPGSSFPRRNFSDFLTRYPGTR
jgi:hypothetical protein